MQIWWYWRKLLTQQRNEHLKVQFCAEKQTAENDVYLEKSLVKFVHSDADVVVR